MNLLLDSHGCLVGKLLLLEDYWRGNSAINVQVKVRGKSTVVVD